MKKSTFLIVGKHAVLEALKNPLRKIERIFLTEDAKKNLKLNNIIELIDFQKNRIKQIDVIKTLEECQYAS